MHGNFLPAIKTQAIKSILFGFVCLWISAGHGSAQVFVAWGDSLTAGSGGTPWTTQFNTLSGLTIVNYGVGGQTSTQVKDRMLANTASHDDFTIIWVGRNNYSDPATVQTDVAAMIGALSTSNYYILSVINGSYGGYEIRGGAGWTSITQLNASLASTYGTHFLDVRRALINAYDSSLS